MENKEEIFAAKAAQGYLTCNNTQCQLHERCLRYDVSRHLTSKDLIVRMVNPNHKLVAANQCPLFRDNTPQRMVVGMKHHFYLDMPARIATGIKKRLIDHNCRSTYYQYHNGKRPITPQMLAFIKQVCREEGWNQPLVFDGETEGFVW